MQTSNILLAIIGIALVSLVVFLIWKNQRDKQKLNPDSQDSLEKLRMDREKKSGKV